MKQFGNTHKEYNSSARSEFPLLSRLFFALVVLVAGLFTKIVWPWKVENKEELMREREDGKGVVVIMNHVSLLDPLLLVISFAARGKSLRPIYKSEYDEVGIMSWFLTQVGGIPVKRGTADMHAVRCAQAALERGESILIYPEGTRIKSEDQVVEIHGGFSLMAQMAGADIVPTAIVGAYNITHGGTHFPHPGRVWVRAGESIQVGEVSRKERKARLEEVEVEAMDAVYALRDALRKEHPGKL